MFLIFTQSTIVIVQPRKTTFQNNSFNYSYANFGVVHYGKSQNYALVVVNQSLCKTTKLKPFKKPTYVVVKGNFSECSFPNKAITAQNLGARGIIFGSEQIKYYENGVVLADDGNGRKVHITSLFITLQDFETLKNLKNIQIRVTFSQVKKQKSQMIFFLSAVGRENYVFLRDFKQYFIKIKDFVNLEIVYHTFNCQQCTSFKDSQCILSGTFCQIDIQKWQVGAGSYIVNQQFRQYNLFKYLKKINQLQKWFDYMNKFDEYCDSNWIDSKKCSEKILQQLTIQQNLNIGDEFSTMMEQRKIQIKSGIYSFPDLTINGVRHMGTLQPISVFQMICQSLINLPYQCIGEQPPTTSKTGLIIGLIIAFIILLLIGVYCYKSMIKKQITNDMSSRVNELVAKYAVKVSEQNKKRKQKLIERMTQQI